MNINKIILSLLFVMIFASSAYAYTITGQVAESGTGNAIENANINFYDFSSLTQVNSTTTNSTGHFVLTISNQGAYKYNITAVGYDAYNTNIYVNNDIDIGIKSLGPQPSVNLYGYVKDTNDAGIQGATIDVKIGSNTVQSATTDVNGFYNVNIWNNTAYNVNAYKSGYYDSVLSTTVIGSTELNFTLTQAQQTGRIYGIVYNQNTANLLDGADVRVMQNGATLYYVQTVNGAYSIDVAPGTYELKATMTGFLENTVSGIYVSFGQNISQDFNMTTTTITTPPGPGDGGGGGEPPEEETTFRIGAGRCDSNWTCTEWSPCVNGYQTRVCTDLEDCGLDDNKPIEGRKCTLPTQAVNKTSEKLPWYTGAAILNFFKSRDNIVAAIIVLLVVGFVITIGYLYFKKK
ncbi:MAG: carboxypeptidase regulatory-like domain-containing protein [Nanoarchaeota archaeon]